MKKYKINTILIILIILGISSILLSAILIVNNKNDRFENYDLSCTRYHTRMIPAYNFTCTDGEMEMYLNGSISLHTFNRLSSHKDCSNQMCEDKYCIFYNTLLNYSTTEMSINDTCLEYGLVPKR